VEDVRQCLDRQGLGEARDALEEEVPAREEGDEDPLEHRVLADDDPADLVEDGFGRLAGVGRGRRGGGLGACGHELLRARGHERSGLLVWRDLPRLDRTVGRQVQRTR